MEEINVNNLLAKYTGVKLIDHLNDTIKAAEMFADKLGVSGYKIKTKNQVEAFSLKEVIIFAAFLHDVGKVSDYFQKVTLAYKKNNAEEDCENNDVDTKNTIKIIKSVYPNWNDKSNKWYPRHNEISWAFCREKTSDLFVKIAAQAVYWHHGTYIYDEELNDRTLTTIIDTVNEFNEEEFDLITKRIFELTERVSWPSDFDYKKFLQNRDTRLQTNIDKLFTEEDNCDNALRFIVRSCVVAADHFASSGINWDDSVKNDFAEVTKDTFLNNLPNVYDKHRFESQLDIVLNNICDNKTTVVKAPAGFGKTLVGLLWSLLTNTGQQTYWVCPRNSVARGVFENLCKELKAFNLEDKISVELFLTSERKLANKLADDITPGKSRIVVTNIDNLLAPMVSSRAVNRIFDVNMTNVVFDEYHEFLSDSALFAAFITFLKARHICCTNVKTLLLSATTTNVHLLWSSEKHKTTVLPNENDHYPAQHTKPYVFEVKAGEPTDTEEGQLVMFNAIKNVQDSYTRFKDIVVNKLHIVHSRYSDADKEKKLLELLDKFGQKSDKTVCTDSVVSSPILQAALDISFKSLQRVSESPESDLQTLGRVNRWGYQSDAKCVLYDSNDKRELGAIRSRYDCHNKLNKLWIEFIKTHLHGTNLTLNEVYCLYNKFNNTNRDTLVSLYKEYNKKGLKQLQTFYPRSFSDKFSTQQKNVKVVAKTLRTTVQSRFVVLKKSVSGEWCDFVLTLPKDRVSDCLLEHGNLHKSSFRKLLTDLQELFDGVLDYKKFLDFSKSKSKNKTQSRFVSKFLWLSKNEQSPVPINCGVYYDDELGIIDDNNSEENTEDE